MQQSILPDELVEVTIADLIDGEIAFTVPWAMFADLNGNLWINGKYSFYKEPFGTAHMQIEKQGNSIVVDKKTIRDHRYNQGGGNFVGGANPIPVILK